MPDLLVTLEPAFWIMGGLVVLVLSGDFLVAGSVHLARRYNIPTAILGLTVLAFGTSAPELVIGISSALNQETGIAIGNVIGSNICNVLLVLGLPAMLFRIAIDKDVVLSQNVGIMIAVTVLFLVLAWLGGGISVSDGVILLAALAGYLTFCYIQSRRVDCALLTGEVEEVANAPLPFGLPATPFYTWSTIILAVIGLSLGAEVTVLYAKQLAEAHTAISPGMIGLSLIAFGTSLPELATTLAAAAKRQHAMAIGNVIGSNIFNILSIVGVTTLVAGGTIELGSIKPFEGMKSRIVWDLAIMTAASLVIFFLVILHRQWIGRRLGLVLFLAYLSYLTYLFWPALGQVAG